MTEGPTNSPAPAPVAPVTPAPAPAPPVTPAPVDPPKGPDGQPFDPDRAQRALESARAGEKTAKDAQKASDGRLAAVLKALGLDGDGKPDPKDLERQVTETTAAARNVAIENLVLRNAGKAGANGDALLDSNAFLKSLTDIDPAAADAPDKVAAAITAALTANPMLKAITNQLVTGPTASTALTGGGGPAGAPAKPGNLAEAINQRYAQ